MKSGCASPEIGTKKSIQLPVLPNPPGRKTDVRESKVSRWRAAALIALTLLMVVHFVQWRMMGRTISPIEPSEAMATLQNGAINAGFIFFTLAILATLIFGRFVCGWGCHILALQDFCAWLLKKMGLTPRPFRSRLLVFVPLLAALYMFVWPSVVRYFVKPASEPFIPEFTNHLVTNEFWATFPPIAVAIPFLFICGFVTVYFLGQKGFCTYACPYGGFFSIADKVAPGRIRVTDACNECGHCTAVCTSNVIVHAEVKQYGMVVDSGCMKCMDCVSVCPTDALYFGFGKPSLTASKGLVKNYSLTWPEEIAAAVVFSLSFLAVWDVYQIVPMLMALGIASITAYLALRVWRLLTAPDQSFYKFNLKSGGSMKKAGWAFLAFAMVWIGLNAHSGLIRYNESAGSAAFESVKIPDELALAQADPDQWLSAADRETIENGTQHLYRAFDGGFLVNSTLLPKLAWLEYLGGNAEQAVKLLGLAADHQEGQPKALSFYYRGAILNRLGRHDEALASLDHALTERPDLAAAREERGESLWQLGRRPEAIAAWNDAVADGKGLPVAANMLAGASASVGQTAAADAYEKQADRVTPEDPFFHWMLALRLKNVGMHELAEKHFQKAIQLDPRFRARRSLEYLKRK